MKPRNKFKIVVGFYMIVTKIETTYEVTLPPQLRLFLDSVSLVISLGLQNSSSFLACLGFSGYSNQLRFWMVMPPVLVALVLASCVVDTLRRGTAGFHSRLKGSLFGTFVPTVLRFLFLTYPLVSKVAFEAFSCYELDNGAKAYLIADVSIECSLPWAGQSYVPYHLQVSYLALLAVLIYPIGLLVLCGVLLLRSRRAIQSGRPTRLSTAINFLHAEYEVEYFWWELAEMFRRLVLVGIFVLVYRGTIMQLISGMIFCLIFQFFEMQCCPFADTGDDFVANGATFALSALFLCLISFKLHSLTELEQVTRSMSAEQQVNFSVPVDILSYVLAGCISLALLLSTYMLVVQLKREHLQMHKEELAAVARRLRFKTDKKEVHAPGLAIGNEYHTFLSHVWSTGQDQMRIIKQRLLEMVPGVRVFLDVDDLEEIGDLERYLDRSASVIVYCSRGYFQSRNCMRELIAAAGKAQSTKATPIIALVDLATAHGGMSIVEVGTELCAVDDKYPAWGLELGTTPPGKALYTELFAAEPIEWNRIGAFQDVTMRLIAERVLGLPDLQGATYVDRELVTQTLTPLPARSAGHTHHVYCSPHNCGALELMREVADAHTLTLTVAPSADASSPQHLQITTDVWSEQASDYDIGTCDHMLLLLNAKTWSRGQESTVLADEIARAMDAGTHILIAHEMTGLGKQEERLGCEFDLFFSGTTPAALLKRGIYDEVAIPLKGGPWREASMVMFGLALGMHRESKAEDNEDAISLFVQLDAVQRLRTRLQDLGQRTRRMRAPRHRQSTRELRAPGALPNTPSQSLDSEI